MDIFNLIRISAILILLTCCIIATFTDISTGLIPNWLTFSTICIGILLTTIYYIEIGHINIYYYVFIVVIFLFSYVIWLLGLWAGGDVKLFTAISTLLIPEYLSVIPSYSVSFMVLPIMFREFSIPTLTLIFNSLICALPILIIYVLYIIFKEKVFLIDKFKSCFCFNDGFFYLNTLLIGYGILSYFDVYNMFVKLLFSLILVTVVSKITKQHTIYTIITTVILLLVSLETRNFGSYIFEILLIQIIILLRNIMRKNLISEVFSDEIDTSSLEEGMVLSKSLCIDEYEYKFISNSAFFKNNVVDTCEDSKILINASISGLTSNDIDLLKNLRGNDLINNIPIKKSMAFGPFILVGLIVTLFVGNSYELIVTLMGMVL